VYRSFVRFWQLPGNQRKLVLQALPTLIHFVVVLKLFGFKRCYERVLPDIKDNPVATPDNQLQDATTAIRRASNGLGIGTCLSRSLALRQLLHNQGVRTQFRIGVDKNGGVFKAHAWLEYNGTPIGETISDQYNAFAELN